MDGPRTTYLLVLGVIACVLLRYASFMPQKRGSNELIAALDCNFASVKLHLQSKAADRGPNNIFENLRPINIRVIDHVLSRGVDFTTSKRHFWHENCVL